VVTVAPQSRDALGYVRSVRSWDLETLPDGV
jgi:hypothetical protein